MKISAKKNVQLFVDQCIANGLKHVVVSPGSRNAPLTISFNQHPELNCVVIPDERSAAFFALGMAQQLNEPVGLLCTSGSAPVNYYPAITEAYYQRVPLVVITADRPQTWVDEGDGQTIVQRGLFANHIDFQVSFDDNIESDDYSWYIRRETAKAFQQANGLSKGPVHINFAFNEPLYQTVPLEKQLNRMPLVLEQPKTDLSEAQLERILKTWKSADKKMILCGQLRPDSALLHELRELAKDPSVLVLVENISNLVDASFCHCIDRSLNSIAENELPDFAPDILVTIGGAVVSKRIKGYLRTHQPREHWKVGHDFPYMDTYKSLTRSYPMQENAFFKSLNLAEHKIDTTYSWSWKNRDLRIQERLDYFLQSTKNSSDITAFGAILKQIPANSELHLANSSVVRYAQLFDPMPGINYWSNRGTSGIDGSSSTAVGAAYIQKEKIHTLITGDMSFFYDSNAFWNHALGSNLRIILVNNGGGSIFKIIPGPDSSDELDEFFVFNNNFNAAPLCETFGINYRRAESLVEIEAEMSSFYSPADNGRPKLLEIVTKNSANEQELKQFFEKLKS